MASYSRCSREVLGEGEGEGEGREGREEATKGEEGGGRERKEGKGRGEKRGEKEESRRKKQCRSPTLPALHGSVLGDSHF